MSNKALEVTTVSEPAAMFSNTTYDLLKKIVQVVLPAIASLYFGLAQIWGLPAAEAVVGTLALLATFFGVLLGISAKSYHADEDRFDGEIVVEVDSLGKKTYSLILNSDPNELDSMSSVVFKLNPNIPPK